MSGPSGRPSGLDWPGLMRAGLHGLGLKPWEFWSLTPAELALMMGLEPGTGATAGAMTRARLDELAARFPDAGAPGDVTPMRGGRDGGPGRT